MTEQVQSAQRWLQDHSSKATLDGMARYAIPSDHALGVAMRDIKLLGKQLGRNQKLAEALWAFCDAMCFNLFDRTPHAWAKVAKWSGSKEEFVKRTAFALLWSLSVYQRPDLH